MNIYYFIEINKGENSCFDPALAEDQNGDLYVAYGLTDGYHQNIEMAIIDHHSLKVKETVPVAIGGAFKKEATRAEFMSLAGKLR